MPRYIVTTQSRCVRTYVVEAECSGDAWVLDFNHDVDCVDVDDDFEETISVVLAKEET